MYSPKQPPVADGAGDAALAALDRLLDLDTSPDSSAATVIAHNVYIPPEARRDDEPTLRMRMVGPKRVLVGLESVRTPPRPVPAPVRVAASAPITARSPVVTGIHARVVPASKAEEQSRWVVAAIWTAALVAFLVLAALVTAHEKRVAGAAHWTVSSNR